MRRGREAERCREEERVEGRGGGMKLPQVYTIPALCYTTNIVLKDLNDHIKGVKAPYV